MAARNHRMGPFFLWSISCLALSLVCGCGGTPAPEETDTTNQPAAKARVPEGLLQDLGMGTLWYYPADGSDNAVQMVELVPGGIFVATTATDDSDGRLKFISRASGEEEWRKKIEYPLTAPPAVYRYPRAVTGKSNEVFYTQLDKVYCLDLKYGDVLWSAAVPHSVSTKVVADELKFYLGSHNGRAYGFDKKQSVEEWTYRTGGTILSSPLVAAQSVFFASTDGSLYRLFPLRPGWISGSSWQFKSGARILADPVVFSRWVIVGSTDYKVYCLEAADGTEYWSFAAEAPIETAPVVYSYRPNQEYVYAIAVERTPHKQTRTLFSIRLRDGRETWRHTGIRKVVAVGKANLYVILDTSRAQGRWLAALDVATGAEKFRIPVNGFDFVPTNSADSGRNADERGKVYLVARDGTMQVLTEKQ